jgi:hypothetical protein
MQAETLTAPVPELVTTLELIKRDMTAVFSEGDCVCEERQASCDLLERIHRIPGHIDGKDCTTMMAVDIA